jgi:cytochrome c
MVRRFFVCAIICVLSLAVVKPVCAGESATPEEVFEMVVRASEVLQIMGEEALPEFNDPKGEFVWKDSYVFVADCSVPTATAHPFIPALIGPDQSNLQGTRGNYFVADLCKATESPNGGWSEYWWPRPGFPDQDFRKISFSIDVPGQPYQVSAGIYNDSLTVEELNQILR